LRICGGAFGATRGTFGAIDVTDRRSAGPAGVSVAAGEAGGVCGDGGPLAGAGTALAVAARGA
jgi:hypothetical protein